MAEETKTQLIKSLRDKLGEYTDTIKELAKGSDLHKASCPTCGGAVDSKGKTIAKSIDIEGLTEKADNLEVQIKALELETETIKTLETEKADLTKKLDDAN